MYYTEVFAQLATKSLFRRYAKYQKSSRFSAYDLLATGVIQKPHVSELVDLNWLLSVQHEVPVDREYLFLLLEDLFESHKLEGIVSINEKSILAGHYLLLAIGFIGLLEEERCKAEGETFYLDRFLSQPIPVQRYKLIK